MFNLSAGIQSHCLDISPHTVIVRTTSKVEVGDEFVLGENVAVDGSGIDQYGLTQTHLDKSAANRKSLNFVKVYR